MIDTILIFITLLALSALFSGIEIAFFSLSPGLVRTMVRQNLYGAKLVERLKQKPRRLLITVLIGNNLVNISAAAIATELAISMFGHEGVAIATGIVTFLILVFGEIFPKSFAQYHPGKTSRYTAPFVYGLSILLSPFARCLEKLMDLLTINKQSSNDVSTKVAEEEIRSLFQIGYEKGFIEQHEKEFAERLFKFNDAPVSLVMKPLEKAVMLDGTASIGSVFGEAAHSGYSRFPVFKKIRSNIIGIVHIKDIMKENRPEHQSDPLASIASPPLFVSSQDKLDDVLRMMRELHAHYALVKDGHGTVTGLITLEDIIEELIGEIYDESDKRKKGIVT